MQPLLKVSVLTLLAGVHLPVVEGTDPGGIKYSACPLIGTYYPPPVVATGSEAALNLSQILQNSFDDMVRNSGHPVYGPITPNTTSFAVVVFTGSKDSDDGVFFEYHHTASEDVAKSYGNIESDTKFPIGEVSMVFTVYEWLVCMGEQWDAPITKFLPELRAVRDAFSVPWEDVTIGALAGHLSGLVRSSDVCAIGKPCDRAEFLRQVAKSAPIFLPDTTPVMSHTAFQLLAFAMQQSPKINGWLGQVDNVYAAGDLNLSQHGEPAALSLVSTVADLAIAGHAMLTSKLISPAATRRWLKSNVGDTSNLRNGVGRPWEVYRAGKTPITPITDIFTMGGTLGPYASYFGLAPDFNAGFAVLAHDATAKDGELDLNAYVDVISDAVGHLALLAASQTAAKYTGAFHGSKDDEAVFAVNPVLGYGMQVTNLRVNGSDIRAHVAKELGIDMANLDFRLYPTNVEDEKRHQFVAVFQDETAPIDAGTPTCVTWQGVGSTKGGEHRFVFELDGSGTATGVVVGSAALSGGESK